MKNTVTHDTCYALLRAYVLDSYKIGALSEDSYHYLLGLIRARNIDVLSSLHSSPPDAVKYLMATTEGNRILRQIGAFLKKNVTLTSKDSQANCAATFNECEAQCYETNVRFSSYPTRAELMANLPYYTEELGIDLVYQLRLVNKVEMRIEQILGDFRKFSSSLPKLVRITSGATYERSKRHAMPINKLTKQWLCSTFLVPGLQYLAREYGWTVKGVACDTNRVLTVPKSWKTDRTIACEPTGNIPFQLAFDTYVKRRLKKFGVDLSTQGVNQRRAFIGSVFGSSFATIDLKNASDTVSTGLVQRVIPKEWLSFLAAVRSINYQSTIETIGDGAYAKFSSMGNGTTFALETLIFKAICDVIVKDDDLSTVYGDDIIVPSNLAGEVINLLAFCGFQVNSEKTYITGPFKESCGADYFEGEDITPFYVRDLGPATVKPQLCHLVNGLARVGLPGGSLWSLLTEIASKEALPLVPGGSNVSSTAGVWVDTQTAYRLNLVRCLKSQPWVPCYKAYLPKGRRVSCFDRRAYFLWHLQKLHSPKSVVETSCFTTSTHKYVAKWVGWFPYHPGTAPDYLKRWSDYITGNLPVV